MSVLTFKFRVKDKNHLKALRKQQWKVNLVWNFCVEYQRLHESEWPSHFDLVNISKDFGREHEIHSDVRNRVCKQFVVSRNAHKKCPKFRSMRKHLGWVPFIRRSVQLKGSSVTLQKRTYRFWKHRDFNEEFKSGCFVQDTCGHWFVCFATETEDLPESPDKAVGIDLGLKELATLSDGTVIENGRWYRGIEEKLATAQRARNSRRVSAINLKIKNKRRHELHVASKGIAEKYRTIVVGNVSSSKLAKTRMAKSVLDAGWFMFKEQLRYKASRHKGSFTVVDEAFTTQTCHICGEISGPRGLAGLNERTWICNCGAKHLRDVNAAMNILFRGPERRPLAGESLPL